MTDASSAGAHAATDTHRRRSGARAFLRDIVIILVAALLVSFLIKTFLIRSFYIPSESMSDTLHRDDRIIVNQLTPDVVPLQRGDVVVFKDPGGWLTAQPQQQKTPVVAVIEGFLGVVGLAPEDSNEHLIKRVIGLPGDTVVCCDDFGHMSVNGVPLDEPYVRLPDSATRVSSDDFEVTVPEGGLWVMGDNRWASADSRYNTDKPGGGFVPVENVVGRAVIITWPIDRWGWLDNYESVFRGVDDGE